MRVEIGDNQYFRLAGPDGVFSKVFSRHFGHINWVSGAMVVRSFRIIRTTDDDGVEGLVFCSGSFEKPAWRPPCVVDGIRPAEVHASNLDLFRFGVQGGRGQAVWLDSEERGVFLCVVDVDEVSNRLSKRNLKKFYGSVDGFVWNWIQFVWGIFLLFGHLMQLSEWRKTIRNWFLHY